MLQHKQLIIPNMDTTTDMALKPTPEDYRHSLCFCELKTQ